VTSTVTSTMASAMQNLMRVGAIDLFRGLPWPAWRSRRRSDGGFDV
jgi:hypothetical protein